MLNSFLLKSNYILPDYYDESDRKVKMQIRMNKIMVEGHLCYDQPFSDIFSKKITKSIYASFKMDKASDLLNINAVSDPRLELLSRRGKIAFSNYAWYLRFRLTSVEEGEEPFKEYIDNHPTILEYCRMLVGYAPKKINRIIRYLNGECVYEIAEDEGCYTHEVARSLESFRRFALFPWVYEDKFLLPFNEPPTISEFQNFFPEADIVAYRYVMYMIHVNGNMLKLNMKGQQKSLQ